MKRGLLGVVLACLVLLVPALLPAQATYPPEVLEAYYQCQERHDLDAIRDLIWYHNNVERVDASVYGLPKDDFDDRIALTVQERLDYRAARERAGEPLATSGSVQYPHHLRISLDHYYEAEGIRPDCSEILAGAGVNPPEPEDLSNGWASDLNITSTDAYGRGEVHIAVDPTSPNRLLVTSVPSGGPPEYGSSFRGFSTDYGQTWVRGGIGNNAGSTWECDPVSYYQRSTGRAYHAKLACNNGTCGGWANTRMRYSTNGGSTFADCGSRPGTETFQDREWITVDNTPTSPCYGNLYVTWHSTNQEKVAVSTDGCATFGAAASLSGLYSAITPDLTTMADGHALVFWHNYASGDESFKVRGSTDCGVSWFAPSLRVVKTKYADVGATAPAQCDRGVSNQVAIGTDVAPSSAFYGRLYTVMFDMNQTGCMAASTWSCAQWDASWSNTCNWDIWLATSDDGGTTWSPAVNLTEAEGNTVDHFLGFARVDPADGSIYIGYHRSRLNPTAAVDRQRTHYFVMRSTDGGATFEPAVQASTIEGDERSSGYAYGWERGDYQGIDVLDGVAWPLWIDRQGVTGSAGEEEIVTRKLCSEPSHWSERAPTFTTPAVTVTGDTTMTVSWDAPDLYWGDGGENPAARKYQLWVDAALVEDDIPATATSTAYTPGDENSHDYVVRAVNQCGVAKDYVAATHGPGIFFDDFESGSTNAWSNVLP